MKESLEGKEIRDELAERLRLRGASRGIIAELLDSSEHKDIKKKKSIDLARELLREGLIDEDTTSWQFLDLHYRNYKRTLPAFSDMLRLEVFFKALQKARIGDLTLLNLYRNIGDLIYSEMFDKSLSDEEDFVASLIDEKLTRINEDPSGYFREDTYGRRWRMPVEFSDSGMIFDSSKQSIRREIVRNFRPKG